MWLINKLTPDFKTIADFRKNNINIVKELFRAFNLFLKEQDLFKSQDIAVDGTKLKAVNSMDKSYTKEFLKKEEDKIDEKINRFLREMDENDEIEDKESVLDRTKVKEIVEKLKEKKNNLV